MGFDDDLMGLRMDCLMDSMEISADITVVNGVYTPTFDVCQ
jgi:hypothetical protein